MNTDLKLRWIDALKSGRFKQGKTFLNNVETGTHCCLGVLCEVMELDKSQVESKALDSQNHVHTSLVTDYKYVDDRDIVRHQTNSIDFELCKSIGLKTIQQDDLIEMNDYSNKTFDEIAEYIEEQL